MTNIINEQHIRLKKVRNGKIMKRNLQIVLIFILVFVGFQAYNHHKYTLAVYIDDVRQEKIPLKNTGYYFDKAVCDNEVGLEWDNVKWGVKIYNLQQRTKCNLYFKTDEIVKKIITSLDTTGKCPVVRENNYVTISSMENTNSLVCSVPDNYGTSYYYRGNVTNNYVKFAGYYWRILRINGDGSIRLVYDGKTAHQNGESSTDRIIGKSAFNSKDDDNAYIGYMYGTVRATTYEKTHANINDSEIKKMVDNWYKSNILGTGNEQNLNDTLFCNYKTMMSGKGYSKEKTQYYGYWGDNVLICHRNDSFTVVEGINGNGALTYPIGLLTRTEALLAGGYRTSNKNYYLYDGTGTWLLTPVDAFNDAQTARNSDLTSDGVPYGTGCSTVTCSLGVKPVINLKPGTLKLGNGTMSDPYQIN